ncbi:MFS transporter [Burkholderia ubonensis]|uniref:MFS transporter n=1 Tax=Burkholderia ubonensis TaxID=101571 RepID=UPI002AB43695|nr:MFS transporter [Burkholderia ubonensis]MDY7791239.1 MFS transporter [Burkholderia ubonensis]
MNERIFRGWYVVIAAHLLLALIFGAAYSFGAFFGQLQSSFGAGRFSVASIFSLTAFIYYAVGVFAGSIADRTSTRKVVGAGVVLLALGFFVSSLAGRSMAHFLVAFCSLVGLGVGLVYVPTVTAVQRWFVRNRSRASGLALAGTGLGTFVGPSLAGLLMQHLSWETTMRVFAAGIAVLGCVAAAVVRGRPEELGLRADGDAAPARTTNGAHPAAADATLASAIRGARFWWYFAAIFLGSVGLFLALVHINPYARQLGLSAVEANLLIGLIGVGNVAGRLLLGSLADRIGARSLLMALTFALALLNGFWLAAHGFVALAVFAVLFGVANGGCISLYPSVAASWFGTTNLGAILGALYVSVGVAAVAGGSIGGLLFDVYGSYVASIVFSALCALASVALIAVAASPSRAVRAASPTTAR